MKKGAVYFIGFGFLILVLGCGAQSVHTAKDHRDMMSQLDQLNDQQLKLQGELLQKQEELLRVLQRIHQQLRELRSGEDTDTGAEAALSDALDKFKKKTRAMDEERAKK